MKPAPPAITVDVEDWPQSTWDRSLPISPRAANNANHLLDLLAELDVRATMFVLGKFARVHGNVVRRMLAEGHEVASHGDGHVEVHRMTPEEFARDLEQSKSLLEDITGVPVRGYRAPDFSIGRDHLWAFDVLAESGFDYDSSIFPIRNRRYGIPDWPRGPVRVRTPHGAELVEFPISTLRFLGRNWPLGGGGYQRLLPGWIFRMLAATVMSRGPNVFYCHPYEFDPGEFDALDFEVPVRVRLHQGLGRRRVADRFRAFVRRFGGCRLIDLCESNDWPVYRPVTDAAPQ